MRFEEACEKYKRIVFLEEDIEKNNGSIAEIRENTAVLRKKNGRLIKDEIDILIYQNNMRIKELENAIADSKAEIKRIKQEINEILLEEYVEATRSEREKILELFDKVHKGKLIIYDEEMAGGIEGDCEVVGSIVTHDKKNRYKIAKLEKVGLKTNLGAVLNKPQILVYDYDKKRQNGAITYETGMSKRVARQKHGKAFFFFEGFFASKLVWIALIAALLFSGLGVAANFRGAATIGLQDSIMASCLAAVAALIAILFTAKEEKAGIAADYLYAGTTLSGIILLVLGILGYSAYGLILPIVLTVCGLTGFFIRLLVPKAEETKGQDMMEMVSAAIGLMLAVLLMSIRLGWMETCIAEGTFFVFALIMILVGLGGKNGGRFLFGYACLAFSVIMALFAKDLIMMISSIVTAVAVLCLFIVDNLMRHKK